ncbi:MAG: homocysteine S-methyltransferase family protein [Spirochaetales bacterium]
MIELGERLILADGSTGTALEALAPEAAAGGRLALLPLENPSLVESLHKAYFDAGSDLVETATFSASARDLAHFARDYPGGAEALSYAVNLAAARAARKAADTAGGKPRLVAGSMGPGDQPPSLGASTYAELLASYLPQTRGLADGGADLAIIETCQDPLQIKAAIVALRSPEGGRGLPFIVSATVDGRGRMLAGADIAAFVAIVSPFKPLALGLNCSGGPDELASSLEELASLSSLPLCFMPNAGLPCSVNGCTSYPFGPDLFAEKVEALARRFGVAVVGGCCGTAPAHIAELNARLADRPSVSARPAARPALSSLYKARSIGPGLFKIGERANSAGSAAFANLLKAENFEGMADKALAQEESGASAIDLHLSLAGRDETADLVRLVALLAPRTQAALCLDSGDPEVLAKALPLVGGRPLLNSTSLEDPARTRRLFALAAEFGAAVVCLAMDGAGPARTVAEKVRICRELYDMATIEFSLSPQDLLFDPLTFTVAAGSDPKATLEAIGAIKASCPGALTVLGVGNVSYGLPKSTRAAVTSLFLEAAVAAGLDAAIMDTAGVPAPESIDPDLRRAAAMALGLGGASPESHDSGIAPGATAPVDPLETLLAWAADKGKAGSAPKPAVEIEPENPADPASALVAALSRGDSAKAEIEGRRLAESEGADRLTSLVTASMAESGRLWNEGLLSLPLVLRSAEAAKRALAPLAASASGNAKGSIVMATVKGDLHDIGKNIVAAILACSGWRVLDLGTDVPASSIVEAARSSEAVAVGLSGLLTRSLNEMKGICEALHASGSESLVLCGGAAVESSFVSREVEPKHPGLVRACADAFDAALVLDEHLLAKRGAAIADAAGAIDQVDAMAPAMEAEASGTTKPRGKPIQPKTSPAFEPPFLGASEPFSIPFGELLPLLERKVLYSSRWGYRREEHEAAEREFARLLPKAEELAAPKAIYGYFRCARVGETGLIVQSPDGSAPLELPFPAESGGHRRTLAAYFSPGGDAIAFFAVTAGRGIAEAARALKDQGKLEAYWHLHGLGSSLAEAAAQWAHNKIAQDLAAVGAPALGQRHVGRRYSFGFPACPGTEYQAPLLRLLDASRIGLAATPGHQLDPEHSVTAFVIARPDAVYFNA